jgi:hypothetical protein
MRANQASGGHWPAELIDVTLRNQRANARCSPTTRGWRGNTTDDNRDQFPFGPVDTGASGAALHSHQPR